MNKSFMAVHRVKLMRNLADEQMVLITCGNYNLFVNLA